MKFCWDNIENMKFTKRGNFRDTVKKKTYVLKICKYCNDEFLGEGPKSLYCCKICSNKDRKLSDETKEKIRKSRENYKGKNHPWYGKKLSKEHKKNISKALAGNDMYPWKGNYKSNNIPIYDTYAHQIEWCEEVRRNEKDPNILEVKCSKCNEWYVPTLNNTNGRIQYLKENPNASSENRFYCSDQCKNSCSIFHKSINTIMKEDAIRAGRLKWLELKREVQPELRSMVLERDKNMCVKCNDSSNLQCHHILPVNIEPLLSADIDNCITLCKECHKEVHKEIDGCKYNQLHIKEC